MNSKHQNLFANVRKIVAPGIICMLLFAVVSCESAETYASDETKEVPFTKFSPSEIGCQWIVLGWEDVEWSDEWPQDTQWWMNSNRVFIINSNEELKKYIGCMDDNYPDIDFSKYTVLLVSGVTPNLVSEVNVSSFQQLSTNKYKLDVEVLMGDATMPDIWVIALVTSKLSTRSEVGLNVTIQN